ncbi:hypothetical protein [Streptomyces sp. NBC_01483]|uniref:hypothetical protein n=1 Tax=Streptomyces sp. NBC_01483 TaxID=2903883 RepID=UPI002E36736B|nr:hypothetical protein [Streptomyces sp. NBC_01483]
MSEEITWVITIALGAFGDSRPAGGRLWLSRECAVTLTPGLVPAMRRCTERM